MINTNPIFTQAIRTGAADVHTFGMCCALSGRYAVAVKTDVQGTSVPAAGRIVLDDVRTTGAFPGYPAWSPPI